MSKDKCCGNCKHFKNEDFPEVTFENSPKKVELIIVEDGTKPI